MRRSSRSCAPRCGGSSRASRSAATWPPSVTGRRPRWTSRVTPWPGWAAWPRIPSRPGCALSRRSEQTQQEREVAIQEEGQRPGPGRPEHHRCRARRHARRDRGRDRGAARRPGAAGAHLRADARRHRPRGAGDHEEGRPLPRGAYGRGCRPASPTAGIAGSQVNEHDLTFRVWSAEAADWVSVQQLSRGTLDQIYLAARLGLVRQVTQEQRPTLIFDDPFVTFDDDRARRAAELLRDLAQDFQVLYLTTSDRYDSVADSVLELPGPTLRDDDGRATRGGRGGRRPGRPGRRPGSGGRGTAWPAPGRVSTDRPSGRSCPTTRPWRGPGCPRMDPPRGRPARWASRA